MPDKLLRLRQIIDALKRQRVRQGDFNSVLDCVVAQATLLAELSASEALAETARHMKSRALELQRIRNSVPKFVVEDLLEESIDRLERAEKGGLAAR